MTGPTYTDTIVEPITDSTEDSESAHPLAEAGQQAADSAGHLASRAADLGLQQADRGRESAANGMERVAETLRRVTSDMQVDQPAISNAAETAAEQAQRAATYLREHDAREILGNVENLARRQPLLFLGGAFVLGVAASRFIKAAAGGPSSDRTGDGSRNLAGYQWQPTIGDPSAAAYPETGRRTRNGNEGF